MLHVLNSARNRNMYHGRCCSKWKLQNVV